MDNFPAVWLRAGVHLAASEPSQSVPYTLLGGGFTVIAALVAGLFLWSKNKADGAKSIAEGARTVVDLLREQLGDAEKKIAAGERKSGSLERNLEQATRDLKDSNTALRESRESLDRAHHQLDDAQKAIRAGQDERSRLKTWIGEQKAALDKHQVWDDELVLKLQAAGVHIRPAPPLSVRSPNGAG